MKDHRLRYTAGIAFLSALTLALLAWNVAAGSADIPMREVLASLLSPEAGGVVWGLRLPRALAAAILGGSLAVSGFLLQTFFANPIAGPFVLGVSSGAKLAVSLAMVGCLSRGVFIGSGALVAGAFAGSLLSMGFVLLLSRRVRRSSMLAVSGVMIGNICSAITDFVVTFAEDSNIVNLHNWSQGSFSGISWENIRTVSWIAGVALALAFLLSKPIGAYQLGETYAQNMGVNVKRFRVELILLSSLLSACVAAFAGPVSFVGVAAPHLVKGLFRTAKPLVMIPACFLGGAAFCLFCDLIARTAFAPRDMSISSVTALFGAPVVLYLMASRRGGKGENP